MHPRLLTVLAAGCLGAATLSVPALTGAAHARVDTCRGAAVSVLGTPGVPLTGTPGNDVVVTNGATAVSTLGGDDLVCVTGGTPYVDTATGNDTVDTVGAGGAPASVWLGAGGDQLFGGDGPDTVGTHSSDLVEDTDTDTVLSGGGDDVVLSGAPGKDNDDTVDLGDGNDRLTVRGVTGARRGVLSGGSGGDTLVADLGGKAAWVVDNGAGVARRAKKVHHRWVAFERFELTPTQGRFTFTGTPSNEHLSYSDPTGGPVGVTVVSMGPGDDHVLVPAQAPSASRYDGGEGRDEVSISSPGERIVVDLSTARIFRGGGNGAVAASVTGFTDVTVWAKHAVAKGDGQSNRLQVGGCNVKAYGLARGDRLKRLDSPMFDCRKRSKLLGGGGRDKLFGGEGRDKLYGGEGKDKARGGEGRDLCRAERRKGCERR